MSNQNTDCEIKSNALRRTHCTSLLQSSLAHFPPFLYLRNALPICKSIRLPRALAATNRYRYMNTTIQKYYYDQIKRAGSLENDVDNFWVNLLPDYFQKRLNYGIERPLPEFTKHADLTTRYIRNGTSKKVVFMEDKCRGKETQSAQWRDALEQLTNYLRLVRAEPTQKPYEMLYGAVNIGTYTRFYQLEPFKQDCVDYPGTDGKPYELAEDEAEIHGILLDLVGKTSDQVPSDD
jgi:hypothetical protein